MTRTRDLLITINSHGCDSRKLFIKGPLAARENDTLIGNIQGTRVMFRNILPDRAGNAGGSADPDTGDNANTCATTFMNMPCNTVFRYRVISIFTVYANLPAI